ncbi:low-temperature-induced 78 kDa protein [Striga asiatica]|uniref:Low-temperature-induced 78 kDa protein n=1 Tax=Striga asiatica TaxID=4170 RepID=A0A5A7P3B4_STRAF|nr:low-temperature-induced 78 kDa protein [Striga asiatica]
MESQMQRPLNHHRHEQDPHHAFDGEGEQRREHKSVLKKVKDKAKKIKDKITKHGHSHQHEDDDVANHPQLHVHETSVARSSDVPTKTGTQNVTNEGRPVGLSPMAPEPIGPFVKEDEKPSKHDTHEESKMKVGSQMDLKEDRHSTIHDILASNYQSQVTHPTVFSGGKGESGKSGTHDHQLTPPQQSQVGGGQSISEVVSEYAEKVAETLRPGEEDRALSEVVTGALSGKKEEEKESRVRQSAEVTERLGPIGGKREGEDAGSRRLRILRPKGLTVKGEEVDAEEEGLEMCACDLSTRTPNAFQSSDAATRKNPATCSTEASPDQLLSPFDCPTDFVIRQSPSKEIQNVSESALY